MTYTSIHYGFDLGESVGRSIAFQNNINDGGSPSSLLSSSVISFPGQFDDKIDDDLMRMESLMEEWCLQLKRNVLVCIMIFSVNYHCSYLFNHKEIMLHYMNTIMIYSQYN